MKSTFLHPTLHCGFFIQPLSALFSFLTILLFLIPQFRVFGQTSSLEDVYDLTRNYIHNTNYWSISQHSSDETFVPARGLDWADKSVVDRAVNWVGLFSANVGGALRQVQTGQLQGYGMAISVGVLFIVGIYLLFL